MVAGTLRILLIGLILVLLVLGALPLTGCSRAKPPRTVIAPTAAPETPVSLPTGEATQVAEASTPAAEPTEPTPTAAEPEPTPTELPPSPAPTPTDTPVAPPPPTPTPLPPTPEPPTATPAVTPTAAATTAPSGDVIYIVKHGDTLGYIAHLHKTTSVAIMQRNGLSNPNMIYVGQKLIIPMNTVASAPTSPAATTVKHTVARGETLSYLARRYRTTIAAIRSQNPSITDLDHLTPGTVLTITVGNESPVLTHRVRPGEHLVGIAARYGTTASALVEANGLANPNQIYVGQVLIIPQR